MKRRPKIILIVITAVVILSVNGYFNYRYIQNYLKYGTILKPKHGRIVEVIEEEIRAIQVKGKKREVDWTLIVVRYDDYYTKWFLRKGRFARKRCIDEGQGGWVSQVKASPDGRYLADVTSHEGHPCASVYSLPLFLEKKKRRLLWSIEPYPGWVSIERWEGKKLLVTSDMFLSYRKESQKFWAVMEFNDPQEFALHLDTGDIQPVSAGASDPARYFSKQLSSEFSDVRSNAAFVLKVLKAISAIPALEKAVAMETDQEMKGHMQEYLDDLRKLAQEESTETDRN